MGIGGGSGRGTARPQHGRPPAGAEGGERGEMRWRILGGTLFLVAALALYGLAVGAAARRLLPPDPLAAIGFYAVAGIVWIFPTARLIRWMQAAPRHRPPPGG